MRRFSIGVYVIVFLAPVLALAQTSCPHLSRNLSFGSRGTDVIQLQQYLISQNILASDSATYFGRITESAVQQWQVSHGIVSSGSAATTGYGAVGPRTRAAIASACSPTSPQASSGTVGQASNLNQGVINALLAQLAALQNQLNALLNGSSVKNTSTNTDPSTATTNTTPVSCTFNGQTIASGASVTAYFSPSAESACIAQLRTCVNGVLSGSFQYASCSLNSTPTILSTSASCSFGGQIIADGASATAYQNPAVEYGSQCVSEQRACTNASLSGTYQYSSCSVDAISGGTACDFNSNSVQNGASVTAYQSSSVAYGGTCARQQRTCTNGTLSGSYAFSSCTPASQTTQTAVYVSPSGSDTNDGTISKPLATVPMAQSRVRTLRTQSPGSSITVYLRGGTYALSSPLVFGVQDGGSASAPVTYASYPGERAILSGGTPVTNFTKSPDGKLYYAALGSTGQRQLYSSAPLTDQPSVGRYPANTEFNVTGYAFTPGSCSGTGNPGKSVNLASITLQVPSQLSPTYVDALGGSELVILKTFAQSRIRVGRVAITGPTELTVYPEGSCAKFEGCNYDTQQIPGYRAHFEGDWHFFEAPSVYGPLDGSYAFANNALYFYARSSDAALSGGVIVPRLERILVIDGAQNLTFDGIDFEHTAWNEPSISGYVGGQSGITSFCSTFATGGCFMPSIIRIANAGNIAIKNATIAHGGGTGIDIESGHDISVERSTIADIAGSGIVAGTFSVAASAPTRVAIRNNTLRSIGRMYDGTAILAPYLPDSDISNNTIADVSYSGISLGWFGMGSYPPSNTNVTANDISNVTKVQSDGGGIYLMQGAAGTHISGNYVHDIRVTDGAFTTNIRPALYLDNAAAYVTVDNMQISNVREGVFLQTENNSGGDYRAKNNSITVFGNSVDTMLVSVLGPYDPSNSVVLNQGLHNDIVAGAGVH